MPDNNITNPVFQDRGLGELTSSLGGQIVPMSSDFAQQAQVIPFTSDSAYNPNLSPTAARLRVDSMPDFFNKKQNSVDLSWAQQKAPTWEGQAYRPDDFREELHSGDYVQKFGTTFIGVDNAERLGERDTDTFGRYLNRAGQKTVSAVLGTIGTLPAMVFGATEGSYEATYNNGFTRMLEDWDKTTEVSNQTYLTKAEQQSFWGKGGLDFVGSTLETAAFTVGTLAGELAMTALTGGGYAPVAVGKLALRFGSKIPKILRAADAVGDVGKAISGTMKGLNKALGAERVSSAVAYFNRGSQFTKNLNTARFLFTSGAFEAGVETNTYKKIAENNYWDEMDRLGKQPTNEEVSNFYNKLNDSATGVNIANHVILGISNTALFGSMVGLGGTLRNVGKSWGKNALIQGAEARLFGVGTREATAGVFEGLSPTLTQKAAKFSFNIGKGFLTEGVWEEGHQGIAQKMATQYVKTAYDKEHSDKTFDMFDSYLKSGEEQFGSAEGLKEVIMGGLIGGTFHSIGAARNQIKGNTQAARNQAFAEVQTSANEIAGLLGSSAYTREDLAAKFQNLNRQLATDNYISEVIGENNPLHGDLALTQKIISAMEQAHKVGKEDYFNDVLENSVFQLDNSKLETGLGLNPAEAEEYKTTIARQLKQVRESYSENRKFVDTLFPKRNFQIAELDGVQAGEVADTMAYVLTMGGASQNTAANLHQSIQRKASELGLYSSESVTLDIFSALNLASNNEQIRSFAKASLDILRLRREKEAIEKDLVILGMQLEKQKTGQTSLDLENVDGQVDSKLAEREQAILDLETIDVQIENHRKNLEVIGGSMLSNFYKNLGIQKEVSIEDLVNYRENLESLSKKTENLRPQDTVEFEGLMTTLHSAMEINNDFQFLAQKMLNPETMYSTARNLLSGKPKPISEKTIESFILAANNKWSNIRTGDTTELNETEDIEDEEIDTKVDEEDGEFFALDSDGSRLTLPDGTPLVFETAEEAREFSEDRADNIEETETIEEINSDFSIVESKGQGFTVLENEDYILDENGQVQWFKTREEAKNRLNELENKNVAPIKDVIATNGNLQLVKNEGVDSGWTIINTKTNEQELFSDLDLAMAKLNETFSVTEDFTSTEEDLNDSEYEIVVNENKELEYKPERKKYKITKKDILDTIKAIRSTAFGEALDVSTILQAYDNVYISEAREKLGDEYNSEEVEDDYDVIGTNVHHLHFSSFYKMILDNGGRVINKSGLDMSSEEALALDKEKYGWEGVTIQPNGSLETIDIYRKIGTAYFTIKEGSIKIGTDEFLTTGDAFFQALTGTRIVEQSGGNTTYKIAYTSSNSGSSFEPLKSNFKHPMGRPSEIAAKTLNKKDKVSFHYDEKLDYNSQLGEKNTETYFKNAVIVVKQSNKVIGYLKAAGRSDTALLALRTNIILKKEGNPLSKAPTAELKMVLPGSLKVTLDENGEVNWTAIKKGENDAQIVSYGFVECQRMKKNGRPNNAYTTENKKIGKLTLTHVKDIVKNLKTGERVYYAVVMHAGKHYAIPVETNTKLKGEKPSELKKVLEKLATLTSLSISDQDVTRVSSLVEAHNKKNPKNKIPVIKDLENLRDRVSEYKNKKGSLFSKTDAKKVSIWEALKKAEKTIMVDLNNTSVFHNPKPVIDFTSFNVGNITPTNKVSKTRQKQVKKDSKEC